jgi:hypothetical protein
MMLHAIAGSALGLLLLQTPAKVAETARVEGEVLDDALRTPVIGARVRVGLIRELANGISVGGHHEEAITDANGRFAFAGIPPGLCQLVVEAQGYAWPPDGSEVRRLQIVAGQTTTGVVITLKRAAGIHGRLFSAGGDPATRTLVKALKLVAERATEVGGAQTDDRGEFQFSSLSEGAYILAAAESRASASRVGRSMVGATTYYPGTPDQQAAQRFYVAAGETITGIQFSIVSAPAFAVSGVVVDPTGVPVPNSVVMLMPDTGPSLAPLTATADADARFHLNGIVAGRYRMMASARSVQIRDEFGGISLVPITDIHARPRPAEYLEVSSDIESLRIVVPTQE